MARSSASLVVFSPYRYAGQVIGTVLNLISPRCEYNGLSTVLNVPRLDGDLMGGMHLYSPHVKSNTLLPSNHSLVDDDNDTNNVFFTSYGAPNSPVFHVTVAASAQFSSTCDLYSLCHKSIEGSLWKEQGLLKRTCIRILS